MVSTKSFITLIYSKNNPDKSRKLCSFLDSLKIDYQSMLLEELPQEYSPSAIGIFVDKEFFTYKYFLKFREEITQAIGKLEEALLAAKNYSIDRCSFGKI